MPLYRTVDHLPQTLALLRKSLGWTGTRMAEEAGISAPAYNAMEHGTGIISLEKLGAVELATGFPVPAVAWHIFGDANAFPTEIQDVHRQCQQVWAQQLDLMRRIKHRLPGAW